MLVTFTTKSYADITMFGDIAVTLLKMMGHSGTVPSAILADDVPEALSRLKSALDAQAEQTPSQQGKDDEPPVSVHNRAVPLVELLTAAANEKSDVMWK
ncbi:hypothetical protein LCGC14_0635580 [marine sediment metagenome]|uniref:DUF1840 domain-containing protein n=1 Tax=marine sediment metagenome TaxID=412755 RepID=A0A0F9U905_9ZZZZ|nr:DUF1840 domain-containing protein [Methylophaga sp.]HEC59259.1 DUF1840 domain-containing protein [Methylophaga sp.]